MQFTARTTIRIRKDLLDQSKILALKNGTSLQEVINTTLALGFGKISDIEFTKQSMVKIDQFRESLEDKKINLKTILRSAKKDLR